MTTICDIYIHRKRLRVCAEGSVRSDLDLRWRIRISYPVSARVLPVADTDPSPQPPSPAETRTKIVGDLLAHVVP